ncbi:Putative ribonuclease H protein At1g65750, partial [Linum perenne]
WRWKGPHRIKFFFWLVANDRLLTNEERVHRHLSNSVACDHCGHTDESVSHVLRDCSAANSTWTANWIRNWARDASAAFDRDTRCLSKATERIWKSVAWEPGPSEAITINTDGSFRSDRGRASAGGIIRSADGRGLVAFTMNLGCCSITRAEIRGAISSLELAWSYGFRQVCLHIDSQAAISILSASEDPLHQYACEVMYFRELCRRNWVVHIRHVYREANKVADFLASRGYEFPFGIHLFPLSDCNLGYLLRYDCFGISEPRLI